MRLRIGIGVSSGSVRVVAVKRQRVIWRSQRTLSEAHQLDQALVELMKEAPLRRWVRPSAYVSLGPSMTLVRRLSGLPSVSTARLALTMVRANADRFFLRLPETSRVAAAMLGDPGTIWTVTVGEHTLEAVGRACRRSRVRLRALAPACSVLGAALAPRKVTTRMKWSDGDLPIDTEVAIDGSFAAVTRHRRQSGGEDDTCDRPQFCANLRHLGSDAEIYADAYGAAVVGRGAQLSFQLSELDGSNCAPHIARRRVIALGCALVLSLSAVVAAPILAAVTSRMLDAKRLEMIADSARAAGLVEAELQQLGRSLRALSEFERSRPSASILLARLTQALPRGSALTAFRMDSSEAAVVTIGRNVMAVLASLETVPAIAGLKATAPVTREIVNGVTLERVSLAFTLRPPASDRIEVRTSSARTVRERP